MDDTLDFLSKVQQLASVISVDIIAVVPELSKRQEYLWIEEKPWMCSSSSKTVKMGPGYTDIQPSSQWEEETLGKWYKIESKEKETLKVTPQKVLETTLNQAEGNKSEEKPEFHIQSNQTDFSGYRKNNTTAWGAMST